jgi:hypothetical protein
MSTTNLTTEGNNNIIIDRFRTSFYKSDEMVQAFRDVGLEYTNRMWDNDYEQFQRKTRKTPEKEREKWIGNLKRFIIPTHDGEEQYIIYDLNEKGKDPLGNILTAHRSNLGCYHKPIVKREIRVNMETGDKEPVVVGVETLETCYSIPFTKENISKIEKYVNSSTTFVIQKTTAGRRISLDRGFDDWKNGNTEELLRFGHKASDYEKQVLQNEKMGKYETYHPPVNPGLQYH